MSELAKKYDFHANQVADWKRQLLEGAADIFGIGARKSEAALQRDATLAALVRRG